MRFLARSPWARSAVAVLSAVAFQLGLAALLLAVNEPEAAVTAEAQPRKLEVFRLPDPVEPLEPPLPEPAPEESLEVERQVPSPAPPAPPPSPPDVRSLQGSTLDLDVDVAIAEGLRFVEAPSLAAAPQASPSPQELPDVFEAWQVDRRPRKVSTPEPTYPRRARRRGIEGHVTVRFVVEPSGRASRPRVVESRPQGYFEKAALRVLERWRFRPAVYEGEPVACRASQTFTFVLD